MWQENREPTVRRWRRWIVVILLLLLGGGFAAFKLSQRSAVNRSLEAIREAGLPASVMELDLWYTQVPVEENGALVVLEAIGFYRSPSPEADPTSGHLGSISTNGPLSPQLLKAVEDYVAINGSTLEKLHGLTNFSKSRYPIDLTQGPATLLPHLSRVKSLTILLQMEAALHAEQGNRGEALHSLLSAFALARTLRDEPILISELVRMASLNLTLNTLGRLMGRLSLTKDELKVIQQQLVEAERDGRSGYFRAVAGEQSGAMTLFEMSYQQWGQFAGTPFPAMPAGWEWFGRAAFEGSRVLGWRDRDLRFYLESYEMYVRAASNQFPALLIETERISQQISDFLHSPSGQLLWVSRMALPSMAKAIRRIAEHSGRLRCAQLAVAVELYRRDHEEKLPVLLEDMVPRYLESLPSSPFNGTALVVQLEKAGYRVICPAADPNETRSVEYRVMFSDAAKAD